MKLLVRQILKILKTGQDIIKVALVDWPVGTYMPYKDNLLLST
jgi:hypothetical protein